MCKLKHTGHKSFEMLAIYVLRSCWCTEVLKMNSDFKKNIVQQFWFKQIGMIREGGW